MTFILSNLLPLVMIYFLFKINRSLSDIAEESRRKDELTKTVKKFGEMFSEASARVPMKKKVVQFEALDDDEEK